jgi:uncharacterized Zn finger protein (UPF0148 family)
MSDSTQEPAPDAEQLQEQIEHTRAELAHTVDALAQKADVKGRAKHKLEDVGAQAKELGASAKDTASQQPWLVPAAVSGIVALLAGWILLRRRRNA